MDKELLNYISRGRGAGVLDEELRDVLLDAGWPLEEINTAMSQAGSHLPIINAGPIKNDKPLEWTGVHRGVFLFVIMVIVFVLVGVIGVFTYRAYLAQQSPEGVTADMLGAFSRVTSFNYNGTLDLNVNYQSSVAGESTSSVQLPSVYVDEQATATVSFSGVVSAPEMGRPKFVWDSKVNVDQLNHGVFNVDFEARLIDDALYLFLSNIDRLPLLDLTSLVGFWLSITPADMANFGIGSSVTAPSANQLIAWRNAIARSQSFYLTEMLGEEKIDNIKVFKYAFILDLTNSTDLVSNLVQISGSSDLSNQVNLLSKQNKLIGEVWVGQKDNLPYKISISTVFDNDDQFIGESENDSTKTKGLVRLTLNLSDFNQDISISVPNSPRSLSSVSGGLVGINSSPTTTTQLKP